MGKGRKRSKRRKMKQKTENDPTTKDKQPPAALMASVSLFFFFLFLLLRSSLSQSPADALIKFKTSLAPQNVFADWAPGSDPCRDSWNYVRCSPETGSLIGINLVNLRLSGTIDVDALVQIPDLRYISLDNNSFTGPIPAFNKHPYIRALYLCNNKFSGEIPDNYFNLTSIPFRKIFLCGNEFTGKIPASLAQIPTLTELHLERNQFFGALPPLKAPEGLTSLDVSNNKLEGQIPESYAKFNASVFAGNAGLCGKPLGTECTGAVGGGTDTTAAQNQPPSTHSNLLTMVVLILIVIVILILALIKRQRVGDFSMTGKEQIDDDPMMVKVDQSSRGTPESVRKDAVAAAASAKGSKKGPSSTKGGKNVMNDLVMLDQEKPAFGMQDLMKASAEVLGNGSLGLAYKATIANGLSVVVKRVKEMNRMGKDAFEAEMRRMSQFRNPNVLTPLSYHFRREEKLIISEHVALGSLLYVMQGDKGSIHAKLNWATRLKIVKGIARGLGFIHKQYPKYKLPHGNLKSSNVLLTKDYEPLLNDYAFEPLINPKHIQALFAYKAPEYVQSQQVSHKSDVYCLGIIILEILTGKFPSQYLNNKNGGVDVVQFVQSSISEKKEEKLIDPEIATESESLDQMVKLLKVGVACTESNPDQRPDLEQAIRRIEEAES